MLTGRKLELIRKVRQAFRSGPDIDPDMEAELTEHLDAAGLKPMDNDTGPRPKRSPCRTCEASPCECDAPAGPGGSSVVVVVAR